MTAPTELNERGLEALATFLKSFSIYTVEDDEDSIRLSIGGQQIACWGDHSPEGIALLKFDAAQRELATALASLSARVVAAEMEAEELKRQVPGERWYWPEDDTSSDACRDSPREALEYQEPGSIDGYSCGGVAYTNFYGWLPPAEDADSDDEFEVDEPTREAAEAKMAAEIARRAILPPAPALGGE